MHELLMNTDFLAHYENANQRHYTELRHQCDIFASNVLRSVSLGTLRDSCYLGHQEECPRVIGYFWGTGRLLLYCKWRRKCFSILSLVLTIPIQFRQRSKHITPHRRIPVISLPKNTPFSSNESPRLSGVKRAPLMD